MPATKFTITGAGAQVAGVLQNITITADDVGYVGDHNITFSGANLAPDTTAPITVDKLAAPIAFGVVCVLTFVAGVATTDMTLYKAESAVVACTDGAISATGADRLTVVVTEDVIDHFDFQLASGQSYGIPFKGTNTLTAQDLYDNPITTFDASADNVTIVENAPLVGTVSGLGSAGTDVLDQASDFVNGVANLTGLMVFTGTGGSGTFTATSVALITDTSGAVGFNLQSQGNPIVIDFVMAVSYQNGGSAPNNLAIMPRRIFWDNPGAATHNVRIEDGNGKVLFEATANAQYDSQYARLNHDNQGGVKWRDFIVTQLDSGQLFIWYTN